jgi:hypothetical protein
MSKNMAEGLVFSAALCAISLVVIAIATVQSYRHERAVFDRLETQLNDPAVIQELEEPSKGKVL